jgi:hypothetical protein
MLEQRRATFLKISGHFSEPRGIQVTGRPAAKSEFFRNLVTLHEHDPLLAVIGLVFAFGGLRSSVSGLVYAVCRRPSSVVMITGTNSEKK